MTTTLTKWTAAKLKRWRLSQRWTQDHAAVWYGCTRQAWSLWENGLRPLPRPLLHRLNNGA